MKIHSLLVLLMIGVSFIGCSSNKTKKETVQSKDSNGPIIPMPVPVSAAHVLLSYSSSTDTSVSATVKKIIGYGATSERIALDSEHTFKMNEEVAEFIATLELGAEFKAEITKFPHPMDDNDSGWRIVKLLDN